MAGRKKIKGQVRPLATQRTAGSIRTIGLSVILLLIAAGVWYFMARQTTLDYGTEAGACDPFADIPVAEQYSQPPLKIDRTRAYFAHVKMANGGEFVIQLFPDKAPKTVNSFVFLTCKGFFNGVTFHRVLDGLAAQTGDPTGTGNGGPGYQFEYEANDLIFDKAGVVAMANSAEGSATNGSQFFITFRPLLPLNGGYTIFGQVVEGMEVVNGIRRRNPEQNPTFEGDVMESVTITMSNTPVRSYP